MKPELLNSLKGYKRKYLINDLMSGLLVAIIALPLSIALGIQTVPAEVSTNGIQLGVVTAIVAGFFISLLGGSRFQVGGPTAAFVVILFGYISNPDIGIAGLQFATILAGIWLILFGVLRFGNVMKYIPYPIVIGFTTGIGITLMFGQLKDFFGLQATGSSFIKKIASYAENIGTFNWVTCLIGVLGLAIIILFQKLNRKIPGAIIAIIVCTLANLILTNVAGIRSVATIGSRYGDINATFDFINFGGLKHVKLAEIIVPSLTIAFLCMIESLLSATVADGMARTKHNSNQELLGQGAANIICAFCGGLPATGAIARTAANINGGAKSSLAGIFHAVFILIMYFALMSVVKYIPLAVFAAILISVAINMSNFPLFVRLLKFGCRDSIVLIVTCALTIYFDLTYGVIGGVVLTIIVNVQNIKRKFYIEKIEIDGVMVHRVHGTVYFINGNKLSERVYKEFLTSETVTLDFSDVLGIDSTSIEKIGKLSRFMRNKGKTLHLVNYNNKSVCRRMDKYLEALEG